MGNISTGHGAGKSVHPALAKLGVHLAPGAPIRLKFADRVLNLDSHELSQDDRVLTLERKQLAVLLELLRRAPHTATHEELLDAVWPDVVVSDNTVHQAIASLRRSLGDQARRPEFIATVAP